MIIRCRGCGAKLWCDRGGEPTLKAALIKFDGAQVLARCYAGGCHEDTPIPTLVRQEPQDGPRVKVRRRLDIPPET